MRNKKRLSPGTKRVLTGIGVAFGTVIIFFVSFVLSFNFIVNPITFTNIGDSDTEKENKELKAEVQSLQDEIDVLNTTVEKYRNDKSATPAVSSTPGKTDSQSSGGSSSGSNSSGSNSSGSSSDNKAAETKPEASTEKTEPKDEKEETPKFTPETTVTPETGIVPEAEEPITVIDIS